MGSGGEVPRYFLHIDDLGTDPDGTELPDVDAARREALLSAREILAPAIMAGTLRSRYVQAARAAAPVI